MSATLSIRFSQSGKTKYFGVLTTCGEWFAMNSKKAALALITHLNNKTTGKNNEINTKLDSRVQVRQRNEISNRLPDNGDVVAGGAELRRSHCPPVSKESGQAVDNKQTSNGTDRGTISSESQQNSDISSQLKSVVSKHTQQTKDSFRRQHELVQDQHELVVSTATIGIGLIEGVREIIESVHRGEQFGCTETRSRALQQQTIDIDYEEES
jgi:hypothetical protein